MFYSVMPAPNVHTHLNTDKFQRGVRRVEKGEKGEKGWISIG